VRRRPRWPIHGSSARRLELLSEGRVLQVGHDVDEANTVRRRNKHSVLKISVCNCIWS